MWVLTQEENCINIIHSVFLDPFQFGTWTLTRDSMVATVGETINPQKLNHETLVDDPSTKVLPLQNF